MYQMTYDTGRSEKVFHHCGKGCDQLKCSDGDTISRTGYIGKVFHHCGLEND